MVSIYLYNCIYHSLQNYTPGLLLASILIFGSFTFIYSHSLPQLAYSSSGEGEGRDSDGGGGDNGADEEEQQEEQQQQGSTETICDDGIDNDQDGLVDLEDTVDCPTTPAPTTPTPPPTPGTTPSSPITTEEQPIEQQQKRIPGILQQPSSEQILLINRTTTKSTPLGTEATNDTTDVIGSSLQAPTCKATLMPLIGQRIPITVIGGNPAPGKIGVKVECPNPGDPGGGGLIPKQPVDPILTATALLDIELSSSDTAVATVQESVKFTFKRGQYIRPFSINTFPVTDDTTVSIIARFEEQTQRMRLNVLAADLTSFDIGTNPVVGGNTVTGDVTLNGQAPEGGARISIQGDWQVVDFPPPGREDYVTIPGLETYAAFQAPTQKVEQSTHIDLQARYRDVVLPVTLTVNPLELESLTLSSSSIVGGNPITGTVSLNGVPSDSTATISLTSSDSAVASVSPSTVTFESGQDPPSAQFSITTNVVSQNEYPDIIATCSSGCQGSKEVELTVTPQPGYNFVHIWNCLPEGRTAGIWLYDRNADNPSWENKGSLNNQYSGSSCPADADPFVVTLLGGHVYDVVVTDPGNPVCGGTDDPTKSSCQRAYIRVTGAQNNQIWYVTA